MKIFIHIGVHKTASTLIQTTMQANRKHLESSLLIIRDTHQVVKNQLRKYVSGNLTLHKTKKIFNRVLSSAGPIENVVISDENLLGAPASVFIMKEAKAVFYPNAKRRIERLESLFEGREVYYIVYTRQQETLLLSLYLDGLKYFRYDMSPEEFIDRCMQSQVRFDQLLHKFDADRLIVQKFETIKSGSQTFISSYWQSIGVKSDDILPVPSDSANSAINSLQTEISRVIAREEYDGEVKVQLRKWLRHMPDIGNRQSKIVLSQHSIETIRQHYQDDITYR